jgi:hypothetical protein
MDILKWKRSLDGWTYLAGGASGLLLGAMLMWVMGFPHLLPTLGWGWRAFVGFVVTVSVIGGVNYLADRLLPAGSGWYSFAVLLLVPYWL